MTESAVSTAQIAPTVPPTRWEYTIAKVSIDDDGGDALNELGSDGWEALTALFDKGGWLRAVFKRPLA